MTDDERESLARIVADGNEPWTIDYQAADAILAAGFRRSQEPEWEYVRGWIAADGRARISQGVIAPSYVADFIAEGGEVVRRRVSKFETVTADMVPVKQEEGI